MRSLAPLWPSGAWRLCVGINPSRRPGTTEGLGIADDCRGLRGFCERMVEACTPLTGDRQAAGGVFFERHGPAEMGGPAADGRGIKSHGAGW